MQHLWRRPFEKNAVGSFTPIRRPTASTPRPRRQSLLRVYPLTGRLCRPRQLLWEVGALTPAFFPVTADPDDGLARRLPRKHQVLKNRLRIALQQKAPHGKRMRGFLYIQSTVQLIPFIRQYPALATMHFLSHERGHSCFTLSPGTV